MNLTANFTLSELVKSDTALRHDMDNTPGETEIENLRQLCEQVLQPVRDYFQKGVKCNSGYRAPAVNQKVGGSPTSDHCKRSNGCFHEAARAPCANSIKAFLCCINVSPPSIRLQLLIIEIMHSV